MLTFLAALIVCALCGVPAVVGYPRRSSSPAGPPAPPASSNPWPPVPAVANLGLAGELERHAARWSR